MPDNVFTKPDAEVIPLERFEAHPESGAYTITNEMIERVKDVEALAAGIQKFTDEHREHAFEVVWMDHGIIITWAKMR